MQYKFNDTEIPKESWCWEAHYSDGTILKQFADDGIFHQFKEIDQMKLALFRMVSNDGVTHYDLIFNPVTMKLIHFYVNSFLRDGKIKLRSYCFGYEKNINGTTVKNLATILPDGNLTLTDDRLNLMIEVE